MRPASCWHLALAHLDVGITGTSPVMTVWGRVLAPSQSVAAPRDEDFFFCSAGLAFLARTALPLMRPAPQATGSRMIGGNDCMAGTRTRAAGADAGDAAFLGRHARPASCACSAATPAARPTSRRGRSARPAPRARWRCSRPPARPRLYSYVIHHRPAPGFTPPYAIAVVELDEGPRMMTNIVDCPQTPEALVLDMPLEVVFEPHERRRSRCRCSARRRA